MTESLDIQGGFKEILNDVLQIFRSTINNLIKKRGRTIRRVILSKNLDGKIFF
jgi:hypothetical protein